MQQRKSNREYVTAALVGDGALTAQQITRKCLAAGAPGNLDRATVELILVALMRTGKVEQEGSLYSATQKISEPDPPAPVEHPDVKREEPETIGQVRRDEVLVTRMVDEPMPTPHGPTQSQPPPATPKHPLLDPEQIQERALALPVGESFSVRCPQGVKIVHYATEVRNKLLNRVASREWTWLVRTHRIENCTIITKTGVRPPMVAPAPAAPVMASVEFKPRPVLEHNPLPLTVKREGPLVDAVPELIRPVMADIDRQIADLTEARRILVGIYSRRTGVA